MNSQESALNKGYTSKEGNDSDLDIQYSDHYSTVDYVSTASDGHVSTSHENEKRIVSNYAKKMDFALEYKNAFSEYLRYGVEDSVLLKSYKSMGAEKPNFIARNDDGYIVTENLEKKIQDTKTGLFPMHEIATIYNISASTLEVINNDDRISATWSESDMNTQAGQNLLTKNSAIKVHPLYAQPKVTQSILEDSLVDIEGWIADRLNDALLSAEEDSFINGDGDGKPMGILHPKKNIPEIQSSISRAITADDIVTLCHAVKSQYMHNASFLMSMDALLMIRTLKDKNDRYLLKNTLGSHKYSNSILGYPVYVSQYMSAVSAGNIPIIFGDFRAAYYIIYKGGTRILRDPFTSKPYVKFYTTRYVGGDFINRTALCGYRIKE